MGVPLLRRRSVFGAKVETTVGTAETITVAECAYNARDFVIQPTVAVTRREGQGGFNYLPGIPEGMMGTCSITHDLSYDGTTIPSWAAVLLPACGWVDTAGVFSPVSQGPGGAGGVKTLTIAHYKDGKQSLLSGAMGTFKITAPTGKVAFITFTFTGKYSTNETDTAIVAPTYPTTLPLRFSPGVLTFNAVNLCTSSVEVDAGNSVIMRECVDVANRTGYESAVVTNRAPVITADPESVLVATNPLEAKWLTSTPEPFSMRIGVALASIVIAAPEAQIENKQQGNRSDMDIDNMTWLCTAGATADSELTITFD
jgi:hypothetical protein